MEMGREMMGAILIFVMILAVVLTCDEQLVAAAQEVLSIAASKCK